MSAISHWPDSEAIYRGIADLISRPALLPKAEALEKRRMCISAADGAYLQDSDGNRYVDLLQAGGASLLGNNYRPAIERALDDFAPFGSAPGLLTEHEARLSGLISGFMPGVEALRMFASGTEACTAAIRMARCCTGRKKVVKMGGGYHGWGDQLVYSLHIPGSKRRDACGIPEECTFQTIEAKHHDLDMMEEIFRKAGKQGGVAAVILEPLGPGSAAHPAPAGFNEGVRGLCNKYGAMLIFDEAVTAFRAGLSGAQAYFGTAAPDMTVLGAALAGGFSAAGAVGARRDVIASLEADEPRKVCMGGALAASPLICAGGYHAIRAMDETDAPVKAGRAGDALTEGIRRLIEEHRLPFVAYNYASICHVEVSGLTHLDVSAPDFERQYSARGKAAAMIGRALEAEGVVAAAGPVLFTSLADTREVIDEALSAFDRVFSSLEEAAD